MITFSDLDRTIIYSNKFLEEYSLKDSNYECIEIVEEKETSYISLKTIEYIKDIQKNAMFIPTTTRTTEQFRRINFSKYNIDFTYAITSNGGTILKNNEPLKEWDEIIEKIKKNSGTRENMTNEFEKYRRVPGILKFKNAGDLFLYMVVDKSIFTIESIKGYIEILESNNWIHYISGRKVYFLPKGITKENAIKYIVDKEKINKFVSMGDSTMDLGMLQLAPISFALKHGGVSDAKISDSCIITKACGMEGSEEILSSILEEFLNLYCN